MLLPLCVRLQQQQLSSNMSSDSPLGISGQYSSALTRRELYRYHRPQAHFNIPLFRFEKFGIKTICFRFSISYCL